MHQCHVAHVYPSTELYLHIFIDMYNISVNMFWVYLLLHSYLLDIELQVGTV